MCTVNSQAICVETNQAIESWKWKAQPTHIIEFVSILCWGKQYNRNSNIKTILYKTEWCHHSVKLQPEQTDTFGVNREIMLSLFLVVCQILLLKSKEGRGFSSEQKCTYHCSQKNSDWHMCAFVFRCTILYLTISTPPVFVCFWLFHSFVRGERKDPSKVPVSARPNYRLPPSNLPGEEGAGRKAISLKHLLFARRGKNSMYQQSNDLFHD